MSEVFRIKGSSEESVSSQSIQEITLIGLFKAWQGKKNGFRRKSLDIQKLNLGKT